LNDLSDPIILMENRLEKLLWWQKAVFYQIYPRSFWDSNGDGIGDLMDFEGRLDYLKDLGVDAIWLSPHYPSPLFDVGYDVADYTGCAPEYGSMHDFRRLLEGAHRRNMPVILDLVLNHTSFQHPWFQESRSSRDNPKRDWYIWRDGIDGKPPNNWVSPFGDSAWEFDPITGQYYYHFFFKEQPDLNWRNPEVKQAMFEVVRFWLDLGVDGYRLDAIGTIFEHPDMPDAPMAMTLAEHRQAASEARSEAEHTQLDRIWEEIFQYQVEQDGMHELMKELRAVVDEYPERVLVGENDDIAYHGQDDELHMVFNFPLMRTERLTPHWIRHNQARRLAQLARISPKAWPCNTLGNHDSPRLYNRFGDGRNDAQLARLSLALMLTLRGTPFLYYGEEIGMTDLMLKDISQFRDMLGTWLYEAELRELGVSHDQAFKHAVELTRDKCRTPMQWSNAPNAGFCPPGVEPWLPVHPNYAEGINVQDQWVDDESLLSFYRRMLDLRKNNPALIAGDYQSLTTGAEVDEQVLAFLRRTAEQTVLVAMNYSERAQELDLAASGLPDLAGSQVLFSTRSLHAQVIGNSLDMSPFEILIAEIRA
jgi:alpha-glucosidase